MYIIMNTESSTECIAQKTIFYESINECIAQQAEKFEIRFWNKYESINECNSQLKSALETSWL